jgi:hypothetical protein
MKLIDDHYGKGIVALGIGGAAAAGGDMRQKATGFGIGCLIAGLAVTFVKTGYGIA